MTTITEQQRAHILNDYIKGESIHDIAAKNSLAGTDILMAIQETYEILKKAVLLKFDESLAIQLAKVDKAENEAWKAWELSKRPKVKKNQKNTKTPNRLKAEEDSETDSIEKIEQQMNSEEREGSSMFLNVVIKCVQLRMELLNLK